MIYRIFPFYLQ